MPKDLWAEPKAWPPLVELSRTCQSARARGFSSWDLHVVYLGYRRRFKVSDPTSFAPKFLQWTFEDIGRALRMARLDRFEVFMDILRMRKISSQSKKRK